MAYQVLEFQSNVDEAADPLDLNIETLHDLDSIDADAVRGGAVGILQTSIRMTIGSGTSVINPSGGLPSGG